MRQNIGPIMAFAGLFIFLISLGIGNMAPDSPPLAFFLLCPIGLAIALGSVQTHLVLNDKK